MLSSISHQGLFVDNVPYPMMHKMDPNNDSSSPIQVELTTPKIAFLCAMARQHFVNLLRAVLPYTFIGVTALFLLTMYRIYMVLPDTSDAIGHFLAARFAPQHPELLLDTWAKPLFTLIHLLPAQWGFEWVMLTNILIWTVTTWLVMQSLPAKSPFSWAFPILAAAAPMYLHTIWAGLTEPLFAMLTMAVVYTAIKKHWLALGIIAGLLPLARPEAVVFWPFALIFLGLKWQFRAILLSFVPLVLISLLGTPHYGTPLWFFTHQTYIGAADIYGSGSFWHYFQSINDILGYPVLLVSGAGLVLGAIFALRLPKSHAEKLQVALLLGLLPVLATWLLHSWLWWQGSRGSLGLIRVLATTIPIIIWLGLLGWQYFYKVLKKPAPMVFIFSLLIAWAAGTTARELYEHRDDFRVPHPHNIQPVQVAEWVREHPTSGRIAYLHPLIGYYLDLHYLDTLRAQSIWTLKKDQPDLGLQPGDYLIWDAQHAPNEGHLPLEKLADNPHFVLRAYFPPQQAWVALNDYPYEYYIFERHDGYYSEWRTVNWLNPDTVFDESPFPMAPLDFRYPEHEEVIYSTFHISGEIQTNGEVYPVFQMNRGETLLLYRITKAEGQPDVWQSFSLEVNVPRAWFLEDASMYIWNPEGHSGRLRNLEVHRKDFLQRLKIHSNLQTQ
jgi:hypothetical protein